MYVQIQKIKNLVREQRKVFRSEGVSPLGMLIKLNAILRKLEIEVRNLEKMCKGKENEGERGKDQRDN